jgi:hypothetical protein
MAEIPNALTAEEWEDFDVNCAIERGDHGFWLWSTRDNVGIRQGLRTVDIYPEQAPGIIAALNALLPDDDPRKITWADVKQISNLAQEIHGADLDTIRDLGEYWNKDSDVERHRDRMADRLDAIAAKLAAMLPPEPETA